MNVHTIDLSPLGNLELINLSKIIDKIVNNKLPAKFIRDEIKIKYDHNLNFVIYNNSDQFCLYDFSSEKMTLL